MWLKFALCGELQLRTALYLWALNLYKTQEQESVGRQQLPKPGQFVTGETE